MTKGTAALVEQAPAEACLERTRALDRIFPEVHGSFVPCQNEACEGLEEEGNHEGSDADGSVATIGFWDEGDGDGGTVHWPLAFVYYSVKDKGKVIERLRGELFKVNATLKVKGDRSVRFREGEGITDSGATEAGDRGG